MGGRALTAEPVTAAADPRIRAYRSLADPAALARSGLFVAEGRFVVQRLVALAAYRVQSLLLTPSAFSALAPTLAAVDAPIYVADQAVMNDIVGFNIHRGCLALAQRPAGRTLQHLALGALDRVVVLEGVNNPDNVGGIFRSAAAFAVDAVVLGPASGDPLYRKAIRTSMAATLRVPFANAGPWPQAITTLQQSGLRVVALTTDASAHRLDVVPRGSRVAILVGNEGDGLTAEAMSAADHRVRIPMTAAVDSLNVTVAASIAMHHFAGIAEHGRPSE